MSPEGEALATPIAIIGMGIRLPGGISTPGEFWDMILNKRDGKCKVPADRYNVDAFYGEGTQKQKVAVDHGYFLDHINIKSFDASFFSAKKNEAEVTDPQQRLLLEVVWECLENAGQTSLQGTNTGVYVGAFGEDWHNMMHRDEQTFSAYRVLSASDYALANRLSYEFDLRGPSMTIRTACSASLTGLHLACQALKNGDCDTAVVAGSSIIMDPSMTLDMSQQGVLSPTGSCKTFDAEADGFARGEAINAILIKPLDKAVQDGDKIRAVIRSTAVNSDGRTSHMGSPSTESQETLIRKAYKAAGIKDLSQTAFFECHGTGTAVGDPLEVAAVGSVFGEKGVFIGSVKPNVGHGEGASGITSIIKAVLALENKMIPPNINFATPNPKISFQKHKLIVPTEPAPWPKDRLTRISVNSFGIGGANAHVIIDSIATSSVAWQTAVSPPGGIHTGESSSPAIDLISGGGIINLKNNRSLPEEIIARWPQLLPLSAKTLKSLEGRIVTLKKYLQARSECLDDLSFTLGRRRAHMTYRSFCLVQDGPVDSLEFSTPEKITKATSEDSRIAFVFTGQGAQWAGMARSLVATSQSFKKDMQDMDSILRGLPEPPAWTIESLLSRNVDGDFDLSHGELSQPLCTALQIAILHFLEKCGIRPCAVVGHSSGEIAAAYATGAMTLRDALFCAYFRGQATKNLPRTGSMAAVGLSRQATQLFLQEGAQIACENSPNSVTISGDENSVKETLSIITAKKPEVFIRVLPVKTAYHSHHMKKVGPFYESLLQSYCTESTGLPNLPFYSTVSGGRAHSDEPIGPRYWRSNLESQVLFKDAVSNLLSDIPNLQTFLEIGPHSALRGPLRQIVQAAYMAQPPTYIPTLVKDSDSTFSLFQSVGRLYTRGYSINFTFINPSGSLLNDLPNYHWDHDQEFWKENNIAQAWRFRKHAHHELLGSRCPESNDELPMWRNILHESDVPWLRDHRVETNVVFPCAGYIAMMGEAIRQMTGSEAYELRGLTVKAALMLPEAEQIELRTTMRPVRVTERTNSSEWFEFSIYTLCGTSWTENCIAQGRATTRLDGKQPIIKHLQSQTRQITPEYFYDHMASLGLRYGPRFQGLRDISASIDQYKATASLRTLTAVGEANYSVHPSSIDHCLQLLAVAGCKGIVRHMDSLVLPVDIRGIVVSVGRPNLRAEATLDTKNVSGNVVAVDDEAQVVIKVTEMKGVPYDTGLKTETQDLARLEWLPHVDFMKPCALIKRRASRTRKDLMICNKIGALAVLKTLEIVSALEPPQQHHLRKYASWLQQEKAHMLAGKFDDWTNEIKSWATSDINVWESAISHLLRDSESSDDPATKNVAHMISDAALSETVIPIFTGQKSTVEAFADENRLSDFYRFQSQAIDFGDFFHLCGHAQPTLKILEIGAGTGSMTENILPALFSESGVQMYSQYVFSDISPGFFADAKDRFESYKNVEYKVLDIEKNPEEQGFKEGSFDIIVASNVLHATKSLHKTLLNVRALLRPGGRLYLEELIRPLVTPVVPFLMGRLAGWWDGESDGRQDVPFVSVERWDQTLRAAGFSGADAAILDEDYPYHVCAHITSQVPMDTIIPKSAILLYDEKKTVFAQALAGSLEEDGVNVHWAQLSDAHKHSDTTHVISTIDLEGPFFHEISEQRYRMFMKYISTLRGGILWLTRPSQIACTDPRYGILNGVARTIRVELPVDFWTAELDDLSVSARFSARSLCHRFFSRRPLDHSADKEFFVRESVIHVGRYHWTSLTDAVTEEMLEDDPKQMVIGQYGVLDSLAWTQHESPSLGDDDIEVEIHHIGLNFRDIMVAMGLVPMPKNSLGFEATGIARRVGSNVDHVQIGDRVLVIHTGLFATRRTVPALCVAKIPENLSSKEAVTIPIVYATVIHCLISVGQLKKGQSILIQSGTGGVGQAALHIAKMIGAEIFVTVGSEEKARHLVENYGIKRDKIFDSHSTSFLNEVMAVTDGRGVDIVLNSLSGELLHASWQCVAKYGKMMEIGKRDILEHGRLALDMFQGNRTFHGIDLESLFRDRPGTLKDLTEQILEYSEHVQPITPIHTFSANKISEAIRFMKKGQHMGKIVIDMPESSRAIPVASPIRASFLAGSSTYLIVGGLGGLGKSVTRWMVEKGARHFCFLSRSAGTRPGDEAFLKELDAQGCKAVAIAGSVTNIDNVRAAIDMSPSMIAGVLQMSMVIKDRPVLDTSYDDWRAVHDCKVKGTWNLHQAFEGHKLDFFVLMSSISGCVGHPGQVNYTSANTFLDSFVQYRQSLGLPCSSINLGGMEGIGFLSERPAKLNKYRSFGLHILREKHLVDSIQLAMIQDMKMKGQKHLMDHSTFYNLNQHVVGLNTSKPLNDPTNRALYRGDPRVSLYHNIAPVNTNAESSKGRDESIRVLIAQAEADPRMLSEPGTLEKVSWEIGRTLFSFLLLPEEDLDIYLSLSEIGIDSLVSIEIRNWWRRMLGLEVTVLEIMNSGTIEGLGRLAIKELKVKFEGRLEGEQTEVTTDDKAEAL